MSRAQWRLVLALSCRAKSEAIDDSAMIMLFRNRHEMEGQPYRRYEENIFARGFLYSNISHGTVVETTSTMKTVTAFSG
jgi:hypothetical protein